MKNRILASTIIAVTASASAASLTCTELLGRPTDSSITINAVFDSTVLAFVEYGTSTGIYTHYTTPQSFDYGNPVEILIDNLSADTKYYYRLRYRTPDDGPYYAVGDEHRFHTQRAEASSFVFAVHADPHLDYLREADSAYTNAFVNPDGYATYENCISNTLADSPDFVIDLGDTSMCEKAKLATILHGDSKLTDLLVHQEIEDRHLLLRDYFGLMGHSVPLFLCQGNHEGEQGWKLDGTTNSWPVLVTEQRKKYFPNPYPDDFYTGNETIDPLTGTREDYYAYNWGAALFVVLDPFWTSTNYSSGWDMTLGDTQYQWLKNTLEHSDATFKFVFCHHLVGGTWNRVNGEGKNVGRGRGGADYSYFHEWGGYSEPASGTDELLYEFDTYRPGWGKPIHQLLVENRVTIFFHGHDHFYGKEERDGVIYQECPQPSGNNYKLKLDNIAEYGYDITNTNSVFLPNSGHLRISVSETEVQVDYVRAHHDLSAGINGAIADSYTIRAPEKQPNVIIFFADDLGFGDVGYNAITNDVSTPTIDALASDGMVLDRYYSYPICGPSRVGLMTGRNPIRLGRTGNILETNGVEDHLDPAEHLLPETFQAAGYQTFGLGKWHLGGLIDPQYQPQHRGFDHYFGFMAGSTDPYTHSYRDQNKILQLDWWRNGVPVPEDDGAYCTDLLTDEAISLIQNRHHNQPFLLYQAFHVVHTPWRLPPEVPDTGQDNRAILCAMASNMDTNVGRILQTLDDEGIRDDTLILFLSDNGGELLDPDNPDVPVASNGLLTGGKGDIWEGGMRVPGLINWPGVIPSGTVCTQLVSVLDWLPTLAAAVGIPAGNTRPLDGVNKWPAIQQNIDIEHPFVVSRKDLAVVLGSWKWIRFTDGGTALYNVAGDPSESTDVQTLYPDIAAELESILVATLSPPFEITEMVMDSSLNAFRLMWNSDSKTDYTIQYCTSLVDNVWVPLLPDIPGHSDATETAQTLSIPTNNHAFFRVIEN